MKIKHGVRIFGLRPEMLLALTVADTIWDDLTITSVIDGSHSRGSLHYVGCAADLRTRDLTLDTIRANVNALKSALGPDFDVVIEKSHVHVEFQPKQGY